MEEFFNPSLKCRGFWVQVVTEQLHAGRTHSPLVRRVSAVSNQDKLVGRGVFSPFSPIPTIHLEIIRETTT